MSNNKITMPMLFDVDDIWSETLGSGWEESPWFVYIKYDGGDWQTPCNAVITHWSKDEEGVLIKTPFTPEMLVRAYAKLMSMGYTHCGKCALDDQDYCTSDSILQHMVYDDWIYG